MWQWWLSSFPELRLLDLDVGQGQGGMRFTRNLWFLADALLTHDERILYRCLSALVEGDLSRAAQLANEESEAGALLTDIHILAGAGLLAEGKPVKAAERLGRCYRQEGPVGRSIRRIVPSLRFILRITPCTLMPFYPNEYGVSLMYGLALWRSGQPGEALDVLREMTKRWGLYDEVRLLAGQIQLDRGQHEGAVKTLSVDAVLQRDAVELARSMYLAHAHLELEQYRSGARVLVAALHMVDKVNPHLKARARLLMAELYERNELTLSALRESARVEPDLVPREVGEAMLEREERWIVDLQHLSNAEIERQAHADAYQLYVPDRAQPRAAYSPLDTCRDPLKQLKPTALSWRDRQQQEERINSIRAQVARGENPRELSEKSLSGAGREMKDRIKKAVEWWPGRKAALSAAQPASSLSLAQSAAVGHLRYDFCGTRESQPFTLVGERRAKGLGIAALAITGLFLMMIILRSCVYYIQ